MDIGNTVRDGIEDATSYQIKNETVLSYIRSLNLTHDYCVNTIVNNLLFQPVLIATRPISAISESSWK